MSYNAVFDAFFGNPWISFGTLFGLLILGIVFRKPLYVNRKPKFAFGAVYFILFMFGLFMILYINPSTFGYGYAEGIKDVRTGNNHVFVMDYVIEAGGEGVDPTYHNRIHVINKKTGEKVCRFLVGPDAHIIFIDDEHIVMERYSQVRIYTWMNGSCIAEWTTETLPELYPELAGGVDQLSVSEEDAAIEVTGLDGRSWTIGFVDRKATPAVEKKFVYVPSNKLEIRNEYLVYNDDVNPDYLFSIAGKQWDDKRKQLRSQDSLLNPELFFLEGKPIAVSNSDSVLIILHYTTTEKSSFLLTAVQLDGLNSLWSYSQKSLLPEAESAELEIASDISESGHQLFVAADNKVVCLDVVTGKEIWKADL